MTVEDKTSLFGAGGIFSDGLFLSQLGLLAVTLLVFAGILALCLMAMRAAASARAAHGAALELHAEIERQTARVELIGGDVERIAQDMAARHEEISAQYQAPQSAPAQVETEGDYSSSNEPVRRAFAQRDAEVEAEGEPKKPGALFRGLLRRR